MLKYLLFTALTAISFSCALEAQAEPDVESNIETDVIEEIPNKKLERRGERIRGPITAIAPAGLMLASFDENADYTVTRKEFIQGSAKAFSSADKNKSKTLSLFELEDWRKKALGSLDAAPGNFAFDKDFDQRITRAEFKDALDYVFTAADKNADETLEFSELVNVFEMPRRPIIEDRVDRLDELGPQRQNDRNRNRR